MIIIHEKLLINHLNQTIMKKKSNRRILKLQKVNIAKITLKDASVIKGGTRSTAASEGQTNEGEHTCVLF
jgi:hypothetical protein